MGFTGDLRSWLLWVIKIRFVIITLVFAIDYATRQLVPNPANPASIEGLGIVVIFWYVVGLFYLIYYQLGRDYPLQAYLQIYSDILIITAVVHTTGDLDSNYLSLYLVAILLAAIVLPRSRAYLVAAVSFVCLGSLLELAYLPGLYPHLVERHPALGFLADSSAAPADVRALGVKIFASLFGFLAVAYLSSFLAERLRETGAELRHKAGQVASLAAINENIIQSMRGGLIRTDLDGSIHEINPAGASILGRDPADLKGWPLGDILPELRRQPPGAGNLPARREITHDHPETGRRTLGISASPLTMSDAGVVGYIYTFQDLTEEKRRDAEYRAKDRMASLGRIAAGIAHEIRNPLASIAGAVNLFESPANLEEDQAKLVSIVRRESSRLDKLVTDFLNYAREQKFEFCTVNLTNLLQETLLLVEHHPLFGKGCRIERRFPSQPVTAWVDPDKIRQVLWNICDNALKAMPRGGVLEAIIEESTGAAPGAPELIRIVLADDGVGFNAGQMDRLFEPFHTKFANGTGLGLAITHQIVAGHQGRLTVQSEEGKGARFVIEIPKRQVGQRC